MEQKKQQIFTIKSRPVLFLGIAFTALLFLGMIFPIFNAFVILPKWISLPAFIEFLNKSQMFSVQNMNSTEQATQKVQTLLVSSSSADPNTLNSSSEKDSPPPVTIRSFNSMGNIPTELRASPPPENRGAQGPSPSPLITLNTTVIGSASPPTSLGMTGSTLDSLNQSTESGNARGPGVDAALQMAPPPKSNEGMDACNIFDGRWVFDRSYPLYRTRSCSFIDMGFDCEGNGRTDLDFMKWRWQPRHCKLPRFNATDMLERLRGRRLVFVGDSINRNQWESMLCLLSQAVPDKRRVYETHHRKIKKGKGFYTFMFMDYHCTVEFYVTHFLVQEGKARIGRKRKSTLHIDRIDKTSSKWKGADILIFNSAHWWSHSKTADGENYYQEGDKVHPRLDVLTAFRRAMTTWASWVDTHVDFGKTQVFFRSYSPSHFWGGQWNSGGRCEGESQPISNETLVGYYPEQMRIVEEVIEQMKTPVTFLNVTRLTEFRKDGHPSIYGRRPVENKNSQGNIQDCSHWCLPGVPDSWNELLYALLFFKTKAFGGS